MSIITLHSKINEISSKTIENAYIQNNYTDGIEIRPGDTISLVSLTLTKDEGIVIGSSNDTLVWRIGGRQQFLQHTVKLTHGTYSGTTVCDELQLQLDNSVLIGLFKRNVANTSGFAVNYTDGVPGGVLGKITIVLTPQTVSTAFNENLFTHYNNEVDENDATENIQENVLQGTAGYVSILENWIGEGESEFDSQNPNSVYMGNKGIFCNGGTHSTVSGQVQGLVDRDSLTFPTTIDGITLEAEKAGGIGWLGIGTSVDCEIEDATGDGSRLKWSYKITFVSNVRKHPIGDPNNDITDTAYLWLDRTNTGTKLDSDNGLLRMGFNNAANASDPASWDAPYNTWVYDNINKKIRAINSVGGLTRDADGSDLTDPTEIYPYFEDPTGDIVSTLGFIGNVPISVGYVDNNLGTGLEKYPASSIANAWAGSQTSPCGYNVMAILRPSFDGTGIPEFELHKINGSAGAYPDGAWRTSIELIPATKLNAVNPRTPGVNVLPGFTVGDSVKLTIEITNIRTVLITGSYKTDWRDTASAWSTPHLIAQSGVVVGTEPTWSNVIKESDFPLRPISSFCNAVYYSPTRASQGTFNNIVPSDTELSGQYDELENENLLGVSKYGGDIVDDELDPVSSTVIVGAPSAIVLTQLWKFGFVSAGNNITEQVNALDLLPNTATIATTLGFTPSQNVAQLDLPSNPVISSQKIVGSVAVPNISVELQDFNINGKNGKTSDNAKIIAIVPKEELATGEDSGTLHYNAPFPIKIDLNVPHAQHFYSMTAMLRNSDGTILTDLNYPTQMVLLHERSELSKTEEMMNRVMDRVSLSNSLKQENEISNIGASNQLIKGRN